MARSTFWPLFRLTVNNTFGLSAARHRYLVRKQNVWEIPAGGLGISVALGFLAFLLYQLNRGFVLAGAQLGQPEIAFTFSLVAIAVLTFISGVASVISVFFFSSDLNVLVPLPLRPATILAAKFGTILITEYIETAVILLPAAIAYAQVLGGGLIYWLSVLVVGLIIPVIPLAVASALCLLLMRFANRRHRDILIVVLSLGLVVVLFGLQLTILSNVREGDPAVYLQQLLAGKIGLVKTIGGAFPPAIWATRVMAVGPLLPRLGALLGLAGLSLVAVRVMSVVGSRFFFAGLIGGSELAVRRLSAEQARETRAGVLNRIRQRSVLQALFWREWRLFMRVPLYVMNGFLASLIVPALSLFPATLKDPEIERFYAAVQGSSNAGFFMALALAGLIVFLAGLNTTSSSAVSREGKNLWISKVIPVRPATQVQAKMLFAAVGAVVSALPVVIILGAVLRISLPRLLGATVLGLLCSVVVLLLGLLYDMARPYLTWTNPQQAVKNNLNVVIPLPVSIGLLVALGALSVWLYNGLGLTEAATMGVLGIVLLALLLPVYRVTVAAATRLYQRLEP
jgi:ABC-2 type transport system permease protein